MLINRKYPFELTKFIPLPREITVYIMGDKLPPVMVILGEVVTEQIIKGR